MQSLTELTLRKLVKILEPVKEQIEKRSDFCDALKSEAASLDTAFEELQAILADSANVDKNRVKHYFSLVRVLKDWLSLFSDSPPDSLAKWHELLSDETLQNLEDLVKEKERQEGLGRWFG